jgi:uncharacterized protein (TIGR02246 family)
MSLMRFDQQELDRFARTFEDLFYRADAAAMATFYAEDAEVMAPDSDPVRGRHAITAFFAAACQAAQRLGMKRTITVRRVERSGDLGFLLSTVVLELPATDDKAARTTFNDVTVWKRDAGGRWLMVIDSANRTTPPQPPQARPGA